MRNPVIFIALACILNAGVNMMQAVKIKELESRLSTQRPEPGGYTVELGLDSLSLVPPNITRAVILVESSGNPEAYNADEGAVGLMQLRPVIYKKLCGMTKEEAFDPRRNVACGTLFLRHLLNRYGGNLEKALLFYNSGYNEDNPEYYQRVISHLTKVPEVVYHQTINQK